MPAVPHRGSWQFHEGVVKRWNDSGLNAKFKAYWRNPQNVEYQILQDQEAKPTPPGPYCVYEIGEPVPVAHMTGRKKAHTENQLQNVPFQLRIHASEANGKSGKKVAIELAKHVVAAFDDQFLDFGYDTHVNTTKEVDFGTHEDDNEYLWVIPYLWLVDVALNRTIRREEQISTDD